MSTRDRFMKNAQARLEEWNTELERLEDELRRGEMRGALEKRTAELWRLHATVVEELHTIERSGDGAWEDRKFRTEHALNAMQESLASVRSRLTWQQSRGSGAHRRGHQS